MLSKFCHYTRMCWLNAHEKLAKAGVTVIPARRGSGGIGNETPKPVRLNNAFIVPYVEGGTIPLFQTHSFQFILELTVTFCFVRYRKYIVIKLVCIHKVDSFTFRFFWGGTKQSKQALSTSTLLIEFRQIALKKKYQI